MCDWKQDIENACENQIYLIGWFVGFKKFIYFPGFKNKNVWYTQDGCVTSSPEYYSLIEIPELID